MSEETRSVVDALGYKSADVRTFEEWQNAGLLITDLDNGRAWAWGDWIIDGETRFSDRYSQSLDPDKINLGTLANRIGVARRWPREQRIYALSWSHYAVAAPMPDREAKDALVLAQSEKWSREELAEHKRAVTLKCPDCGKLMGIVGGNWKCLRCGHEQPYVALVTQYKRVTGLKGHAVTVDGNRVTVVYDMPLGDVVAVGAEFTGSTKIARVPVAVVPRGDSKSSKKSTDQEKAA